MKNLQKKKILSVLISVLVLCLIVGTVTMLVLHRHEEALEEQQNEALQELYDNEGRYDPQSIVLSNTTKTRAENLAKTFGAKLRITGDGRFAALTLPEGVTVFDIYENDEYRQYIEYMSLDYQAKISDFWVSDETEEDISGERLPIRPQYTVGDTDYNRQTYLDYLNMSNVWNKTKGSGITVAVIDTGIDTDHPEFAGRISEYSYNATEDKIVKDWLLEDGSYDWSLIEDEQGHGTAVTGVIAASMNGNGIVGIAPQVNIIVIKAECKADGTFERSSDLAFGLYYAIERDVSVVNMSFGTADGSSFTAPTQLAFDSDIVCVAAAGNKGSAELTYPAAIENVFGVGALAEDSWELASYSNYGENVDFVAPGTVYTTKMGGGYGSMDGTSFASPIAAGVLALYMSQNRYAEFNTIEELIYASCYDLGDLGPDLYYGYGALDVSALMLEERGKITFNMMTDELDNTEQVFIRTHTLQNMPEPERLYAVFDGWYYDPQCTDEYVWYEDEFYNDLTLYANWVNEEDGIPFTYVELDDGTIEIRSYTGHRRYITIPDYIEGKSVSSIGEFAFAGEAKLCEVKLPKYLKRIRNGAFLGCSKLASIEIPDTVTEIGESAFSNNVRLSALSFGVDSQLVSIGDYAFSGCSKMRSFTVPSKVTQLNATVFYQNTSIMAYAVQDGNTAFFAKDGVLFNHTGSTLVCYPAGVKGSYTIPQNVKDVADYAFACTRLNSVVLSNVESLGTSSFAYGALESIEIPDSVTFMGEAVFKNNSCLHSAHLGAGMTNIPGEIFAETALTSIEIPANIRSIGAGAFLSIGSLAEVTFEPGSTLTYIGERAFFDSGVVSIEIPASVITIESGLNEFGGVFGAFSFPALSSLTFEEGSALRSIGDYAFKGQSFLTDVHLPDGLDSLGDYAFKSTGLQTVNIPASLTSLGEGTFASCHSLTDIFVDDANTHYLDVDGVVYNTEKTVLVEYPAGNERTSYNIPDGITDIGAVAFHGSWNLQYVSFQDGLKYIHPYAFYDTRNIERIDLPNSVEILDEYSFYGCGAKQYALSQNLREIKAHALSQNTRLTSIAIPDSVMQISNYAFAEDWNLSSVIFTENAKLPRISYGAFAYCGLTSFRVPTNVSTIAQGAFMGCEDLTSFTFAKNSKLESISAYMFDGCSNLRTITFEKGSALTSIQAHGLEGMRKLTKIDFGDAKLQNIDNFAFRFCERLTRFDIPEGVTFLGRYAFYYCTNLSEVTVPSTMDFIGRFAFLGTKDLNVYFAAETLPTNLAEDWDHGIKGYYLGVNDVVTDGDWQYAKLTSGNIAITKYNGTTTNIDLNTLNLGGDIVSIGGGAFMDSTVESIVLPDTLQIIQADAFYHSELKSVSIPANVTFIGRSAFAYTPIGTLTFAADAKVKTIEQSAFEKTEKLGSVVIPASITTMGRAVFKNSGITSLTFAEGFSMTEIPEDAFAYTHISTVTIPDSVTLINHNAFREIKELKSVTFGGGEELMIMSNVFYQSGLESVYIPENVGYVGEYAFVGLPNLTDFRVSENNPYYKTVDGLLVSKNCRKLISVPAGRTGSLTVPEGIEVIGFGAFEDSKLSEIKFLDNANILSFGYRAFYNADSITEMHIPASVVAIDYYAFAMCDNLQKVTFAENNNLKGVYEGAFYGCKNLSEIMLPDSIVEISDFAFYGCRKLTDIPVSETSEIKGIYDYAFAYAGFSGDYTTPETLIDIGAYAFMGNKFTSVTIPDTHAWELIIGIGAFEECHELTEIILPFIGASFEDAEITWFGYIFGAGSYEANVTYVPESLKKVNITQDITILHAYTFYGLGTLEEVLLPESIGTVGYQAFEKTTFLHEFHGEVEFRDKNNELVLAINQQQVGVGISGHFQLPKYATSFSFNGCKYLESVDIPEGITTIPYKAFENCESLVYVNLPDSLTRIEFGAFGNCKRLKEMILPSSVTYIDSSPFFGCTSLEKLYIPDGVTELSPTIFRELTSLKDVRFPATVKELDFYGCTSLETVALPEGMTSVCFSFCKNLKEVHLPSGITAIPEFAFRECVSLKEIILPEGMTSIGRGAFQDCTGLVSLVLPANVTSLGVSVFAGCTSLISMIIPDGVTVIEEGSFRECINLQEITLGSGLQTIDLGAFSSCTSLYQITNKSDIPLNIGDAYSNGSIAHYAKVIIDKNGNKTHQYGQEDFTIIDTADGFRFHYADGKYQLVAYLGNEETVTFPIDINGQPYDIYHMRGVKRVIIPEGITSIGAEAFRNCSSLEYIEIPDSITRIENYAFYSCPLLSTIVWSPESELTHIGEYAFYHCDNLVSITLPETLTTVDYGAFIECSSLVSVIFTGGDVKLGNSMFNGCSALTEIILPQDLTVIPDSFLSGCLALTSIELPLGLTEIKARAFSFTGLVSMEIPHGITTISQNLFGSCYDLKEVIIPESVTTIGKSAFDYCWSLESLTIPEGVVTIGDHAFMNCIELKNLVIPTSVTHIGRAAFSGCNKLEALYLSQNLQSIGEGALPTYIPIVNIHPDNAFYVVKDGIIYDKAMTRILHVSENVTEAVIPPSVTKIQSAFSDHTQLEKVTFEEGSTLTEIPSGAFSGCTKLSVITWHDGIKAIGNSAFQGCESLRYIEIPDGVTMIGSYTFHGCTNLERVVLPDSVTEIAGYAFYECSGLININMPKNLKCIGDFAFNSCDGLTYLEFPEGLTHIGERAFQMCDGLTTVVLPQSLEVMAQSAFNSCLSLYQIINRSNFTLPLGSTNYSDMTYHTKVFVDRLGQVTFADEPNGGSYVVVDDFLYTLKNGTYTMMAYLGKDENVTLPTDVNGSPYTVYKMRGVTRLTLPEGITAIPDYAFAGCYSLVEINLPNSLTSIGRYAFHTCENLKTLVIPDQVNDVKTYAFAQCVRLSEVTLGRGMNAIGEKMFGGCRALTEIHIPDNIQVIGSGAFSGCTGLRSIIIPDSVTTLERGAFSSCSSLEKISLSQNITRIHPAVFTGTAYYKNPDNWTNGALYIGAYLIDVDEELVSFILREDVEVIAEDAFDNCRKMKTLALGGTHQELLSDLTNLETLIVTKCPAHRLGAYFNTSESYPVTLRNLVLAEGIQMKELLLLNLTGVTIYVGDSEKDTRWDENFPGWNYGNTVVYGDKWITAVFHDENGKIISSQIFRSAAIIRQPYKEDYTDDIYRYIFLGYDMDGDGIPDTIPATSTTDLAAYAVYTREYRCIREGHAYGASSVQVLPTCTNEGINVHFCIYCGTEESYATDPLGHQYTAILTRPTCLEEGYTTHTCIRCQFSYKDSVTSPLGHNSKETATCTKDQLCDRCGIVMASALGHEYQATVTHPTCTVGGSTLYACIRCVHRYADDFTDPLGHSSSSEATCTQDKVCDRCGIILIPASGHQYMTSVVYPTCTEGGYTVSRCVHCDHKEIYQPTSPTGHKPGGAADCVVDQTCIFCDYVFVEKYGHDYETVVTAPTCLKEGYTTYTCKRCGECYMGDVIPATGHTSSGAATCVTSDFCKICYFVITPALGHDYTVTVTPPTCTEQGFTTYACNRCDNSYKTLWTQATGHQKGSPATCTEDQICTVCGITLVRAYGHDYLPTVTSPTCTAQGYTTYDCSQCDESYIGAWTDPVAHTPGADATCTEDQLCTVCGKVLTQALGHTYNPVVTPPTCTENGYTTYNCLYCQHSYVADYVPVSAHSYHSVITPPTCSEKGYTTRTCTACGYSFKDEITDATGHVAGPEATCTEHQLCLVCDVILTFAQGHDTITERIPASCINQGYTIFSCTRCDMMYTGEYTAFGDHVAGPEPTCTEDQLCTICGTIMADLLGHDDISVVTAPTCIEEGYTTHTCSRCGDVRTDTFTEPYGHTEGNPADCLNDQVCIVCGVTLAEQLGHNYCAVLMEGATCTEPGRTTYRCTRCSDSYVENTKEPHGHLKGDPANCVDDQTCIYCGFVLLEKLGHEYEATVTEPTCTEAGRILCTCTRCGDTYVDGEPPALGHTASDWIVDQEAAPGVEGSRHIQCTACGEILETSVIEALPMETETEEAPEATPETFRETESLPNIGTENSTIAETVGEVETETNSQPSASKSGCTGNVTGCISLLIIVFIALPAAIKRKKETE